MMIRKDTKRVRGGWVSLSSTARLKVCIYRYLCVCVWPAPVMAPSWIWPPPAGIRWILCEYVCNEALACERQKAASSTGETFDLSSVPCWRRGRGRVLWKKGGTGRYVGMHPWPTENNNTLRKWAKENDSLFTFEWQATALLLILFQGLKRKKNSD